MIALYSERCCRLRDEIGRHALPLIIPEMQILEKRRHDIRSRTYALGTLGSWLSEDVPQLSDRIDDEKEKCQEKEGKEKTKVIRIVEDGLLMVVSSSIYGRKIRTLIDSGATRCFVSPACVAACGLKGLPCDIFLELGNSEKILSRGYIPDVPVVIARLTVKIGLTITNLLHDVDLVLGMNWLQTVNPAVDWCSAKLFVPQAVHTALLTAQIIKPGDEITETWR